MVQQLGTLTALRKDSGSVPGTHTHHNYSCMESNALLWPPQARKLTGTHIHVNKI